MVVCGVVAVPAGIVAVAGVRVGTRDLKISDLGVFRDMISKSRYRSKQISRFLKILHDTFVYLGTQVFPLFCLLITYHVIYWIFKHIL